MQKYRFVVSVSSASSAFGEIVALAAVAVVVAMVWKDCFEWTVSVQETPQPLQ